MPSPTIQFGSLYGGSVAVDFETKTECVVVDGEPLDALARLLVHTLYGSHGHSLEEGFEGSCLPGHA